MSRQLITEYRSELDRIHAASGSKRESVVREAFKDLLKRWGKSRDLIFLAEHEYITPSGDRRYIDGALVHSIRVPFGYWEAKDTNDVLDEEIRKKTAAGYPRDNIIYEDTDSAVLGAFGDSLHCPFSLGKFRAFSKLSPKSKWLKDRRGRSLNFDDVTHYQRIVKILVETDRIMKEIELPLG